mmetsp:Transcript_85299/g.275299  ORF Transcript_85299/g.275299 Transcript_85299/m.275299 type:complete len:241 (-) Transcript_85299:151-873(-)
MVCGEEDAEKVDEPLLAPRSFVRQMDCPWTVDSEVVAAPQVVTGSIGEVLRDGPAGSRQLLSCAMPPCDMEVQVSESCADGQPVRLKGPQGEMIFIRNPPPRVPGKPLRLQVSPLADFRIEVPPGKLPGDEIKFNKADGTEVCVRVPKGHMPGEIFDVLPPAMMVAVPSNASPGDLLVFPAPPELLVATPPKACTAAAGGAAARAATWCRARVPEVAVPEEYIAARIPKASRFGEAIFSI